MAQYKFNAAHKESPMFWERPLEKGFGNAKNENPFGCKEALSGPEKRKSKTKTNAYAPLELTHEF